MDRGQRDTEALLKQAERKINQEYKKAMEEMEVELLDYFQRFEKKDETWRTWVENGSRTKEEYEKWRIGQMAVGRRWQDQINSLAKTLTEANTVANGIIRRYTPEMYADNYNYSTYEIEKGASINTSFNLINKEAVERLMTKDPEVLPPPGKKTSREIAEGKAMRWNKQQLQSVMLQGLMQGDSIPKLATRLATTVGDRDRKASIRNARTMATGASNAGRVDAYKRAQSKGVDMEQMWLATMDNRTRHSHRWLDREVRPVGEAFSNGCEYPGDPKGDPAEIYNCRCSLRGVVKGLERRSGKFRDESAVGSMSYDEWRRARSKSNPIDLPEKKSKATKMAYLNEYKSPIAPPATITYTPKDVDFRKGCRDATEEWLTQATPNSHEVEQVTRFKQDGVVYDTSMNGVVLNNGPEEVAIAQLIKEQRGGIIKMIPTVTGEYKGVQTCDYLIDGSRYDLKTMRESTSSKAVQNAVKKHEKQADNFILDITNNQLGTKEIIRQTEELYEFPNRRKINTIVLVEDQKIIKVYKRK